MADIDFVARVAGVLQETGLPAEQLEIEITETSLQSVERSSGTLRALKELGVQIAIDDFGTGFSSLSKLKHLSIDRVKIDQSFIRGLPDDQNDVEVTRAIAALCLALKLRMTAEGIETGGTACHAARPWSATTDRASVQPPAGAGNPGGRARQGRRRTGR